MNSKNAKKGEIDAKIIMIEVNIRPSTKNE